MLLNKIQQWTIWCGCLEWFVEFFCTLLCLSQAYLTDLTLKSDGIYYYLDLLFLTIDISHHLIDVRGTMSEAIWFLKIFSGLYLWIVISTFLGHVSSSVIGDISAESRTISSISGFSLKIMLMITVDMFSLLLHLFLKDLLYYLFIIFMLNSKPVFDLMMGCVIRGSSFFKVALPSEMFDILLDLILLTIVACRDISISSSIDVWLRLYSWMSLGHPMSMSRGSLTMTSTITLLFFDLIPQFQVIEHVLRAVVTWVCIEVVVVLHWGLFRSELIRKAIALHLVMLVHSYVVTYILQWLISM